MTWEKEGINRGAHCKRNQSSSSLHRDHTTAVTRLGAEERAMTGGRVLDWATMATGGYRPLVRTISRAEAGSVYIGGVHITRHAYNVRLWEQTQVTGVLIHTGAICMKIILQSPIRLPIRRSRTSPPSLMSGNSSWFKEIVLQLLAYVI